MMLLAKAALGLGGALVAVGAYTFHEGVIRVDVDEHRAGGSHIHMWMPAAVVPMTMHLVPSHHLRDAAEHAHEFLPLAHTLFKELKKFPDAQLVEVDADGQHVEICTHNGRLQIDVHDPGENVHLLVPLSTLDDVVGELEENVPGA
ncbi:MAG TPA: hypothetical protein VNB49_15020 [Candidatus Dormibacteraeota bacterium]|nr:hypothetical protein [Candidatus Dormibacteraeota bacterium]